MDTLPLRYFKEQVGKGIRRIFYAQLDIADHRIYKGELSGRSGQGRLMESRSGVLRSALENPSVNLRQSGEGVVSDAIVPTYIRFLDMRRYGNFHIYNRQVWGILYSETRNDIKYEYRDWLHEHVGIMLSNMANE